MTKLEKHRRAACLSVEELAIKAGMSPTTVWRIETGRVATPHAKVLRQLAEALGVPHKELR